MGNAANAGRPSVALGWSVHRIRRLEVALAILAFAGMLAFYARFATNVAGDSDPFGYVSEAILLSQGQVASPEHAFGLVGLPEDTRLTYPLGFVPYTPSTLVPTYPFGYPLLMALGIRVAGLAGAYLVTPLLAAAAVVLTYFLARIWLGRIGGLLAACLVFLFPNYTYCALMEWSDVPATFFAVLSLYLLLRPSAGKWSDIGLGAALGYSVWVRPNMVLLVLMVGIWLLLRREWQRGLRIGLTLLPFALVGATANQLLYGAPWVSGYGNLPFAASFADALARALRYLERLQTGQVGIGLVLVGLGCLVGRVPRSVRALLLGIGVVFLAFFSAYGFSDDAWWYGRFLLPTFPAIAVLEAGGLIWLLEAAAARIGPSRRWAPTAVAAAALLVFGYLSGQYARHEGTFALARSELKWVQPAELAEQKVQQPAIVLSMVYSGSLRFYGHLATVRYDTAPEDEVFAKLAAFERAGGHVYAFGEQWELDNIGRMRGPKLQQVIASSDELYRLDYPAISLRRLHVS